MKNLKRTLTIMFGLVMIVTGIIHFIRPQPYFPFIPDFLPKQLINVLTGMIEVFLGIGVFIPQYRSWATLGILLLMIAFLPLHMMDVFKENPAIGSHKLALIRLPLQFVLIWWALYIHKKPNATL